MVSVMIWFDFVGWTVLELDGCSVFVLDG